MQKAGGIIGLIGGIFGFLAAIVTLLVGGMGKGFGAEGASTVIGLGWGGVLFSFLCIIFGAASLEAKRRFPATMLTISSVLGALLGGTLVAVCMALVFVGGIVAVIGTKQG